MREIGGYFGLELTYKSEYHQDAIKLSSGRNAFKYILEAQDVKKVYLPNYICDSIIEPLEALHIEYSFYNVNEHFELVEDMLLNEGEKLLVVNFFSLKAEYINQLSNKYGTQLIVDNTQAFFERPIKNVDTIYSARKFFGVSDGGYLYSEFMLDKEIDTDVSYASSMQLLGRKDLNAASFYAEYQIAEERLINQPMKLMSELTKNILGSIDYEEAKRKRKRNFNFLHENLKSANKLKITMSSEAVPFVYPFYCENTGLRDLLIKEKVYVARYWNEVLERAQVSSIEKSYVTNIIPLPIDQRYNVEDMTRILNLIESFKK